MSQTTRFTSTAGVLLAVCAAFAGCAARTDVSATGSTPSQFTHLYITTQSVWLNTNANASPDDSGWTKFDLKTPVTVDLVTESNGTLGQIASDLRIAPGTYNSILLLPVAPSAALADSANAVGATYNNEADYVDTSNTSHQVQLVLPNQEKGIVVPGTSLTVPIGGSSGLAAAGALGGTSTSTGTTNSASTLFGSPTTVNPSTSTTSTSSTNNTVTVSFATSFDGNRDLHIFGYTSGTATTGVLLSTSPFAADLSKTGGISGTLTLTSLTNINNPQSNRVAIQACAESLSTDGSHHVVVACAPVQTDGTFTIYPLQSNSTNPTTYDVVIHGPNIQTIIVKNVSVATTAPTLTPAATTAGSVASTTAGTPVSIGTFIPTASVSYTVTVSASTSSGTVPAGAAATFYQTLPGANEVPYAIDEVGVDPVNLNTANLTLPVTETLSAGLVNSGTFSSTGTTITVTSATPQEGGGSYKIAATAPLFTDGITSTAAAVKAPTATQPAPAGTTNPATPVSVTTPAVQVTMGGLVPANGSSTTSITATVKSSTFDKGLLMVSHNGALIGATPISGMQSGPSVVVNGLPGGSSGPYYVSAIAWSSTGGGSSSGVQYQSLPTPVTAGATGITLTFN